jgi:hypothetical protein
LLEILIVFKKMGNLNEDFRQIAIADHALVERMQLVIGAAMIFSSTPCSSSINSAPIGRARMTAPEATGFGEITRQSTGSPSADRVCGNEAVIPRIEHRGMQEAVDELGAGLFVDLVFYRRAALRDFDDHVHLMRWIGADWNLGEVHGQVSPGILCRRLSTPHRRLGCELRVCAGVNGNQQKYFAAATRCHRAPGPAYEPSPAALRSAALIRSCQPGPSAWKKSSTSRSMRSDTVSLAPGSDVGFGGSAAGFGVVIALKAFSAAVRESVGRLAMPAL